MSSSSDSSAGDNLQSIGECAGIDLINQPAEARNWVMEVLKTHMKKDQSVTVGNYCYLDGDKHVKVSIAMDVISAAVASEYVPQPAPRIASTQELTSFEGTRAAPLSPTSAPLPMPTSSAKKRRKHRRRTPPTRPGAQHCALLSLAPLHRLLRQFVSHLFSKAIFAGIKSCSVRLRALNSSPTLRRL